MPGNTVTRKRKRTKSTKKSNKRTKSAVNKKSAVARTITTADRDFRVDYVAPTKPKYNKSVKRFQGKVMKALQRTLPMGTRLFVKGNVRTVTTAITEQCFQIFHLKPWQGSANTPGAGSLWNEQAQADMYDLATIGLGSVTTKTVIKYAEMEITVQNPEATSDMIVDLYELVYVKKAGNPINQYASLKAAVDNAQTYTTTGGTAFPANALTVFGITPFDIVAMVASLGIKVEKKVSFSLKADGIINYIMKDYRRTVVQGETAIDLANKFCVQGVTRSVLLIGRGAGNDAIVGFRASVIKRYQLMGLTNNSDLVYGGTG